ncbi:sensor histidine kinase [Flectobacillus roseus]|uniref:sensor histidine kinase n=1 Tax=Flectobacillus roseus TaxID=502259 RepID=UPI0024B71778|nr:histidine kinase [Flectobacillus roseus]MDI9871527.1 histidine kinase [Flectobacillus roseus]
MKKIFLLIYLYLIFGGNISLAQDFPLWKYTPQDGLAQSQVLSYLKDSRGIIWVGTYGGLSRFDGEHFTNYTVKDGLLGSTVTHILEDSKGYIWVLCRELGFVRFDGKKFEQFPLDETAQYWSKLILLKNGELIVSWGKEVLRFNGKSFEKHPRYKFSNPIGSIFYLKESNQLFFEDVNQNFFQETSKGIVPVKDLSGWVFQAITFNDVIVFESKPINEMIRYFIFDGYSLKPFLKISPKQKEVINTFKYDFIFSNEGKVYLIKAESKKIDIVGENLVLIDIIDQGSDNKKLAWLPTEKGLVRLTKRGFRQFSESQVPNCWSVVQDKDKQFYFSNYSLFLQKYDGTKIEKVPNELYRNVINRTYRQLNIKDFADQKSSNLWYFKSIRSTNNDLWFPSNHGMLRLRDNKWTLFTSPTGHRLVFAQAYDTLRGKIIGTSIGRIFSLNIAKPNQLEYLQDTNAILFKGLILCAAVSPKGEYWLGGKCIGRYNPETKRYRYYKYASDGSKLGKMLGLAYDWEKRLWAYDIIGGVYVYNEKKDSFDRAFKSYFNTAVSFVEQIDHRHLAFGNSTGIHILDLSIFKKNGNGFVQVFNHHNGYNGIEPNQLGSYRDFDGNIWITSGTILSKMIPSELDYSLQPLKIHVLAIGGERYPFIKQTQVYELPNQQNSTTFTLESIGDNKPFRSQYSFRIKGFINEWSEWQEQNKIMVNNLSNGEHIIEFRTRMGNLSTSSSSVMAINIRVNAPFYKSPNFYKYATITFFLLMVVILIIAIRSIRQSRKLVSQSQKIGEQEHKVRFLQVQTIQAQMNPHFTFNVLGTLQHLILNNETQKASENLLKLSTLIRNYLEASLLTDNKNGSLFSHEIQLSREVELLKMYIEFEQLQYVDRFEYEISLDGKLNTENYRVPPLILQPFVENAIKHGLLYKSPSEKGMLLIRFISLNEDTLICTIEDNGVGRTEANLIQTRSLKKYKSRGTELVKRRVDILNEMGYDITITVDDGITGGTVVTIQIGYK